MTGVDALFARALALEDAGQPEAALGCYDKLVADAPDHADAWHNRGLLLARMGRLPDAERSHREYVRLHPQSARAQCDLSDALLALGRYDAAAQAVESAAAQGDAMALLRRGIALSCLRRFAAALESFSAARAKAPEAVAGFVRRAAPGGDPEAMLSPENIFLARGYSAQGTCDWSGWDAYVAELRNAATDDGGIVEPAIAYQTLLAPLSGSERHAIARRVALRMEAGIVPLPPPPARKPGRIRIGLLSPDFRDHVVGYFLLPWLELADRSRFELFAYSLTPGDGSRVAKRLRGAAEIFRSLEHVPDDGDAAKAIRSDDIDILVELGGHMERGRFGITLRRPARLQAAYAGFTGSLGSRRVDFAIVDRTVAPDPGEWSEGLVYMPSTYYLYDFRAAADELPLRRADYGLPEDAFVFCAFHNAHKITPDTFALWMEILRATAGSVLWFRGLPEAASLRLRSAAAAQGVDASRLIFAPFEPSRNARYLARQRLGDLLLDALHHNAITNACDALGVGLPVLTLRGNSMATRAGESLLRAAGLPELVAENRAAFVQRAVALARDRAQLSRLRRRLTESRRRAPLFDTAARVRDIEACLEEMFQVSDQRRSRL